LARFNYDGQASEDRASCKKPFSGEEGFLSLTKVVGERRDYAGAAEHVGGSSEKGGICYGSGCNTVLGQKAISTKLEKEKGVKPGLSKSPRSFACGSRRSRYVLI